MFLIYNILSNFDLLADVEDKTITLDKIVVTARESDNKKETGDVKFEEISSFFSVIERDSFEGKMEDLSDVVEKEAGIQVRQSGGLGSYSTVSLRGSSGNQVMVYIDGILLNEASGGNVNLSNISLSDVESIEIYRGLSPINFGSASIGGVVNIRTRRTGNDLKGSISSGYGSFNTWKLSAFVNHKLGMLDYLISADYLSSDNDFKMLNDNGTQYNPDDDIWEKRKNNRFDQQNILATIGFDFTEDLRLVLSDQYFAKYQEIPNWNNADIDTSLDTTRNISIIKIIVNDIGKYHFNMSGRIDYSYNLEEYDDSHGSVGLGNQHTRDVTSSIGSNIFFEWPSKFNILTFVTDIRYEEYRPDDIGTVSLRNESSRRFYSFGLEDTILVLQKRLIIRPGLRYRYIRDDLKSGTDNYGEPTEERTEEIDSINPQIGIKYQLLKWLTIRSNLARYVREPSLFELFGDRGFFNGNDELKAEKGTNFDTGFELNILFPKKTIDRIFCSAAYFVSDIKDIISYVYDARGIGRAENISKARIDGIESNITVDLLEYLQIAGGYTWQKAINHSEIPSFNGKRLPGRFEHSFIGRIEGRCKWFKIYYNYIYETGMYYDTSNLLEAEDKKEHNAGITLMYQPLIVTLEAKNVGNNRYEDFNGFPQPGRSYFVTLKYSF